MNTNRNQVPKWIKRVRAKPQEETDSNKQPMNFHKRDARKQRPAQNKGRHGLTHHAKDNTKHRR